MNFFRTKIAAIVSVLIIAMFGVGVAQLGAGADTNDRVWTEARSGDGYWSIAKRLAPDCTQAQRDTLALKLQARNHNLPLYPGSFVDYLEGDVPVCGTTTTTVVPFTTIPVTTTIPSPATTTTLPTTTVPQSGQFPDIPSNFSRNQWLVTGEGIPSSSASEPSGNFRTSCGFSHLSYDDAIVYPGQPGKAHLHMYFGNIGANAFSTYESLRTTGSSTCQGGPLNRSAYWIPAVQDTASQVIVPAYINVYYKGNGTQTGIAAIKENPNGLRMIAGYDMLNPTNGSVIRAEWSCNGGNKTTTIPSCPAGSQVIATQRFPMCWDGSNLDSSDHRKHMAYGTGGGGWITQQGGCPSTHPIHLPEFTLNVGFISDGNSQNWFASSDRMPGMAQQPNGSTFHADWFGAWDNPAQSAWTKSCIVEMRNCVWGQLGDGTRLTDYNGTYTGPNRITPPPR